MFVSMPKLIDGPNKINSIAFGNGFLFFSLDTYRRTSNYF